MSQMIQTTITDDQEFIRTTLNDWKLTKWYDRFIEEDIDKDTFLNINESEVSRIITTIGGIRCFLEKRRILIDSIKSEKLHKVSNDDNDDNQLIQLQCQNNEKESQESNIIICLDNVKKPFFVLQVLKTVSFSRHLYAYRVLFTEKWKILKCNNKSINYNVTSLLKAHADYFVIMQE